jgi:integrase
MRFEEIDGQWWTIPVERQKTGYHKNRKKPHQVFLSPLALEIIGSGAEGFVFPGPANHERPAGAASLTQAIDRSMEAFQISEHFTAHDLRRTATTLLTKHGISRFVADRIQNHADNTISAVYDQNSYSAEKQHGLEVLGRVLEKITRGAQKSKGDNIIRFPGAGR